MSGHVLRVDMSTLRKLEWRAYSGSSHMRTVNECAACENNEPLRGCARESGHG